MYTCGDDTRRLKVVSGAGMGAEFLETSRECDTGTNPEFVERDNPPVETILDLGGEPDEASREMGDAALPPPPEELLVDNEGDKGRLLLGGETVLAVDVA